MTPFHLFQTASDVSVYNISTIIHETTTGTKYSDESTCTVITEEEEIEDVQSEKRGVAI